MVRPVVAASTAEIYDKSLLQLTAGDDALGYPLLWFVDAFGRLMDEQDVLIRDVGNDPGWSLLYDLDRIPDNALAWLGQHIGVDAQGLGRAAAINLIKSHPGFNRGTVAVITAAARKWLTGGRYVRIYERDTSPYHFTVRLFTSETGVRTYDQLKTSYPTYPQLEVAYPTYAQLQGTTSILQADLLAAKPAGLQMTVRFDAGETYDELDADFLHYNDVRATMFTYDQLHVRLPGGI